MLPQLSDTFAFYNLRNLGLKQNGLAGNILLHIYTLYFFVIATKAQLRGEVRISEKTVEGGEKI